MKKVTTTCKITEFKARCLEIIASVTQSGEAVEVTRRGSSMVRVVPAEVAEPQPAYGFLRGSVRWDRDEELLSSGESWDAES